jgi:SAM-dependent methyltransferase
MSTPGEESQREHSSTYFVQDRSNEEELRRLALQDRMVTASMGGVLPEQPETAHFQRVLDVGCGTGGWLIEVAKTHPEASLLIGVDVSKRLLDYAREQAEVQQVADRVELHTMDALCMLEFPTDFFDLVNLRFGLSYVRTWEWPKLLQEFQRVAKPGGIIRITEPEMVSRSNSPAHMRLQEVSVQAMYQAGNAFQADGKGMATEIPRLLQLHNFAEVQTRLYELEYRADNPQGQLFIQDTQQIFRIAQPFLRKWTRVPDDYEEIYQQMLVEIQQPDFVAEWKLTTVWGFASSRDGEG